MMFFGKKKKPASDKSGAAKSTSAAKPVAASAPAPRRDDAPITVATTNRSSKPIVVPTTNAKPHFPHAAKLDWKLIIFPPQSIRAYFEAEAVDVEALEQELQQGGIPFSMLLRKTKPSQLTISGKVPIRQLVLGGVRFYGCEELIATSVVV